MRCVILIWAGFSLVMAPVCPAIADEDIFDFFAEEARVVSASRQPQAQMLAPATVHVITAEDLAALGAQTLWDALRTVPGVDVMIVQTFQGEVSIRGLNKAINNRVLVLLDGKPVLSGYFERVSWEYLPVGLAEIDRIEVVLGAASALYGPNAISGVINIITQTPDRVAGGRVRVSAGEYHTLLGHAVYGRRGDRVSGKVSAGWRSTRLMDGTDMADADGVASQVGRVHGALNVDLGGESSAGIRGGMVHADSRYNMSGLATMFERGPSGYLRGDYRRGRTRMQAFWNRNRTTIRSKEQNLSLDLSSDILEGIIERTLKLSSAHTLTMGSSLRQSRMRSDILSPGLHTRTLWSLFFEHQWVLPRGVWFVLSGRLDRHSTAGWQPSPRGSVVWAPSRRHVFRVSAGTSFRFPTITESQLAFTRQLLQSSEGPFRFVDLSLMGQSNLKAERMRMCEAAYTASRGRIKASAVAYLYRLSDVIASTVPEVELVLPVPKVRVSFENRARTTRSRGGELGLEADLAPGLTCMLNYAYQDLDDVADPLSPVDGGPEHKLNLGVRLRKNGWTAGAWAHWTDETLWHGNARLQDTENIGRVDAYTLVNGQVGYRFSGGLTLGVSAFNLLDHAHYETLPTTDLNLGQHGELVRRRVLGTVSYTF